MKRFSLIAAVVLGCLSVSVAAANLPPDDDLEANLVEARSFDEFALYYAGMSVDGLPLTRIDGYEASRKYGKAIRHGSRWFWNFGYGDCELPEGEGGCALPASITVTSTCRIWASAYFRTNPSFPFHGARAAWTPAGHLDVYTGRTTITIYGWNRARSLRVASALRRVRDDAPMTRLPPPVKGSLQGRLPCQGKPGG